MPHTIDFGASAFVEDVAVRGHEVFVAVIGSDGEPTIQRSTDLASWAPVPFDAGISQPRDLASGDGIVIATPGIAGNDGYYRLDAAGARFVAVRTDDGVVPTWIGEDGTAMAQRSGPSGNEMVFADALGAAWRPAADVFPEFGSSGVSFEWAVASEGTGILFAQQLPIGGVSPIGVNLPDGGATRVLRSDDHGATFVPFVTVRPAAAILEASSDGTTLIVRVRGAAAQTQYVALDETDAWVDRTAAFPTRALDGVTGLESGTGERRDATVGITRSRTRRCRTTVVAPGRRSISPTRRSSATSRGRCGAPPATHSTRAACCATIGGFTSLCCDGSETGGSGYRPGAGVWRLVDGAWQPLNAGIPIAFGPPPSGGAPFRTDIASIASTDRGLLATLVGRGVYGLRDDRWSPVGAGLPVDAVPTLAALDDTAIAWGDGGIYVLEEDVWASRAADADATEVVTRHDLAMAATGVGVQVSTNRGAHWTTLGGVDNPRHLAVSRTRLFATDAASHVHAIALTCTEAM